MSGSKPPETAQEMAVWFIEHEVRFEWLPDSREFKILERSPAIRDIYLWDINVTGRGFRDRPVGDDFITHYGPF